MKKLVLIFTILMTNFLHAQFGVGDLAFIAFNADADDDFALVTFVDIPANTIVYFTDSEWNGSTFGTDENDFSWNSGTSVIPEGTVITFNTISATASVSVGIITGEPGGISGSAEAIFAFLGTAPRTPTTFIAAVANSDSAYGSLDNTGLTAGTSAITYPTGTDVAQYTGPRTGLQANGYVVALNEVTNYTLANDSGDQSTLVLPLDTTPFVISDIVPEITFGETAYSIPEDGGSLDITIEISSSATTPVSVDIAVVTNLLTANAETDFTFADQTVTFPANSINAIVLNIPISNDTDLETDELFLLELSNPINATLGSDAITGIYILDEDSQAPTATNALNINYITSYLVDASGSAEISAHDAATDRLFVLNSEGQSVEILDFSDLNAINNIATIDLSTLGTEGPTSVATKNGFVVAAISNGPTADGVVAFMDLDGNNMTTVIVGNLPDMVAFTPDGTKILVANEGQPNSDYSIDPEGSITVIDVSNGFGNITQANVTNLNFNAFDADIANLRAQDIRIFGPGATVSQDVEPEFITFSNNSQTAWVSLQENNAIAVINLITNTITDILPLGLKDHSLAGNTLDVSDETDFIFFGNWPIKGMYMPDAIASYEVDGITYLVTANEGDAREYDTYEEEVKISDSDLILDPTMFPNQSQLALEANLGELTITNATGDTDGDGDLDEIHAFGSRSFSIWNTATGDLVYDSGDDFERITAADPVYGALFNASNSNNNFKNRSDNKGPEPEGVTIAEIEGQFYAFITLERVGGFMAYNITNPSNPVFENYVNNRDLGNDEGGDLAPEGIIYISPEDSPSETALIVLSNEVSSTVSVYSLDNVTLSTQDIELSINRLKVFPNPIQSNQTLFFNQKINLSLFDIQGRELLSATQVSSLKLPSLSAGTYVIKTSEGVTKKIIIE
jgi:hypothetical protein